jgi:hypothetical protein
MKYCVHVLSSRTKCLKIALESFYKYANKKFKYDIYVYHFDDIYSKEYIEDIHKTVGENIFFIELDYKIPENIDKRELFFYRKNDYAQNFGSRRLGYLHAIHYFLNFNTYPGTKFEGYTHTLSFDDETQFFKEIEKDIFKELDENDCLVGSMNATIRTPENYKVSQRHLDTREKQFEFVNNYIEKYNINHETEDFKKLKNRDTFYHTTVLDSNVFNMKFFELEETKRWQKELNEFGGDYKYRWGDHELLGLFCAIHNIKYHNFKTTEQKYMDPSALRNIQATAPGVKINK